jgi:hypothetical protein
VPHSGLATIRSMRGSQNLVGAPLPQGRYPVKSKFRTLVD